jgi:predicted RNA binding protein YcfA (HicA-like mRNA interferase family)
VGPRLRRLSGADVVRALRTFGFDVVNTRGSHAKLRRIIRGGEAQILTVPLHKALAPDTAHAIYRQASRFIPEEELRTHFWTE